MARYKFTKEDCQKGARARMQLPDWIEHQENAYEALKFKRPDAWRKIYETFIYPKMQERYPHGKRT